MLPEVEGWVKVAAGAVAVLMALLVPVRSWVVEDRRFRKQTGEGAEKAGQATIAAISAPTTSGGTILGDALAMGALTEAVRDVAKAVRESISAEGEREKDRLTKALEALIEQEKHEREGHPRPRSARPRNEGGH